MQLILYVYGIAEQLNVLRCDRSSALRSVRTNSENVLCQRLSWNKINVWRCGSGNVILRGSDLHYDRSLQLKVKRTPGG